MYTDNFFVNFNFFKGLDQKHSSENTVYGEQSFQ